MSRALPVLTSIPRPTLSTKVTPVASMTPAVIVGADADALGIARSLGRAGVPVIVADSDARRPGMHSRYARPFVLSAMSGPVLIDGLLALRTHLDEKPVLFPTTDLQVRTVSQYQERLAGAFHIRLPDERCVCELLDKRSFQQVAERHGFPVPRAITVREERDFANLTGIRFPAVIKPPNKELYLRAPRALIVSSRAEAEAACRAILPKGPELILQEWIEGGESDIYFCLQYRGKGGDTVSSFTGRKLRCWPPQTGSTASCIAAPELDYFLGRLTKAFFDKVGFVGMCSMEFKQDQRNGEFYMIEPTVGRTDWQEEVASLNGVNIPLDAYRYELGLPPSPSPRTGAPLVWKYPPSYWRSILVACRNRRPAGVGVKSACWCPDDPVPLAFFWREWILKVWSPSRWYEVIFARAKKTLQHYGSTGQPQRGTRRRADTLRLVPPQDPRRKSSDQLGAM